MKRAPFPEPAEELYGTAGGVVRPAPIDRAWEYDPAADAWKALTPSVSTRADEVIQ